MFYKHFRIQTKSEGDCKFRPNRLQQHLFLNKTKKNWILKARQHGITTLIKLEDLENILTRKNIQCLTVADSAEHAEGILEIVRYAWMSLPEELRQFYRERYRSKRQIYLDERHSGIRVSTSGRSGTAQRLHISEWAFFSPQQVEETKAGSMQAVPKDGEITIETTSCGMNHAKEDWDRAQENGYKKFFYNWMWSDDYTLTPPNSNEWRQEYKELALGYHLIDDIQERFKLSDRQFYWYFMKARMLKELVKQEYPTTETEAFLTSGQSVFDLYRVSQIKIKKPLYRFDDIVDVWQEPREGHKYTIGMDTAEGVDRDNCALAILDITDMNQVGEFASARIEPHEFAVLGVKLAKLFNNAYIIPERNGSGLTTVTKIRELGYSRIYITREIDKITKKVKNEYGWRTSSTNRDIMIDELVEAVHEGRLGIYSEKLINEMKTFVRRDSGKREHEDGKHDDRIFALMLAFQGTKTYGTISDLIQL